MAHGSALAFPRIAAFSDRTVIGGPRLQRGLQLCEGMRGAALYAAVYRSNPTSHTQVVQHGDLRQSRKTGCSSKPAQGAALEWATVSSQHTVAHADLEELVAAPVVYRAGAG